MNRREVKRAPVLRFKGFTNDWEQRKLIEILKSPVTDGPHETPQILKKGVPFISVEAIVNNKIDFNRKRGYISFSYNAQCNKKYRPQKKDVLLVKSGSTVGKVAVVETNTIFNIWSPLAALRVTNSNDPYFLYYLLQTNTLQRQIINKSKGGTQPNLSMRILEQFKIFLPQNYLNQQKIEQLLRTLDKCISLQQRKLKLLRTLKSGLSFKLFNKKHLNNLSQISLDQIGQTYSGLTGKSKKDFGHGHAFYVSYLNVNQNEIGNPKQIDRIEIDKKQNLVQKNDIFFTISSETPEEVGLTSLWPVSCKNLYLNSFCFGFRINTKMFIPLYLGYLFRSEYFREKVLPLAQGISRYNLSKNNVLKMKIGQEEIAIQEKYAKVMNDLDSDILRQKKKVKELKLCKKFLLQNMFI
ncbi:restriction endonuclease subunit S [Lactobacillus helveticus]|uniref:restriction endonuclease subunit S n=1 Tax=Lactobacillus helveticus TaxID=1587 RepID=UPI0021A81B8E|nr:restriction endonuclease subunit S [Lactobacillus helveticus]MCT3402222.1 restriction endonuclease subunit S [Lactobacillus helveticus]